MRIRTALAIAAAVTMAAPWTAGAAPRPKPKPKPICNLVVDPAGDVRTGTKSVDILSADVVTDGRLVTGVIRVAKLADLTKPGAEASSPTGGFFQIQFTFNGSGYTLTAQLTPAGAQWGPGGKGTGTADLAKNEVRIHVKTSDLAGSPVMKPGALLTNFVVRTDVGNPGPSAGATTFSTAGDTASGNKAYPVGHASCVRQGA